MDEKAVVSNPGDPKDPENNLDGCDVAIDNPTSDEDLPAAEGGEA